MNLIQSDKWPVSFQPKDFPRDVYLRETDAIGTGQYEWWGNELPPKLAWLVDPTKEQFETPVDERGRVDAKKLVALVKSTIDPSYEWNVYETRKDHLNWPWDAYSALACKTDSSLPISYCDLPSNKLLLPLQFERWKHAITVPADFVSRETMHYSVEAWRVAHSLFTSVKDAVRWERLYRNRTAGLADGTLTLVPKTEGDAVTQEFMTDTLMANFRGVAMELDRLERVPAEFRLVEPDIKPEDLIRLISHQDKHHCRDGIRGGDIRFAARQVGRVATFAA